MDKSELQLKKKTDIMETYKKNKMIILDLNEKKERYIRELEDFRAQQQVLVKEMIAVNMELENYKEGVENFIQDNPKLGIHDLKKKTNTVISKFFEVLNPNILADQTKKKISFNIDDGKIIISKKV